MESTRATFERDLKAKLAQKAIGASTEQQILERSFKFFDLDNDGHVSWNEFGRACERLGVFIPTQHDLKSIFAMYDVNGDGHLEYKEFAGGLYGSSSKRQARGASPQRASYQTLGAPKLDNLVDKIRAAMKSRGTTGIFGMGRAFRIADDNGSRSLEFDEFTKAMRERGLDWNEQEFQVVFKAFDTNGGGNVDYDEFLRFIRGPMNPFRRQLVHQAFDVLDENGSGTITMDEIQSKYNAKKHPDVLEGKKTEEEVLFEFMETFQVHHNTIDRTTPDNIITLEEFEEYYNNISMSIDNDQYFELMITNAWKLGEAKKTYASGWSNTGTTTKKQTVSQHYGDYYEKGTTGERPGASKWMGYKPDTLEKPSYPDSTFQTSSQSIGQTVRRAAPPARQSRAGPPASVGASRTRSTEDIIEAIRAKLRSRGARTSIGIQRQFKIADDDRSGKLNFYEFWKAMNDFGTGISEDEGKVAFDAFDRDGSGEIDYDEFIRTVRGEMNQFRVGFVKQAFDKLDKDKNGQVEIDDVKGVYNAKHHPDVLQGKKTETEVLGEFLETFETHHNIKTGYYDHIVTWEEFVEYYNHISANIDNDQYFELMITNAWKLGQPATHKPKDSWSNTTANSTYNKFGGTNPYVAKPVQQIAKGSKTPEECLAHLREILKKRGARGIIGIARSFRIIDDNRSQTLDIQEIQKASRDFRTGLHEDDVLQLFNLFDRDNSGALDYEEFLRGVRGEMNDRRKQMVMMAYNKMDADGNGVVEVHDVRQVYNAKKHPDVISGKRDEEEVLLEFLETFQSHYAYKNPGQIDGIVTKEEWIEYYNNISMSIDEDDYFELMIRNAWHIEGGKGWCENTTIPRYLQTDAQGNERVVQAKAKSNFNYGQTNNTWGGEF